jgi:Dihydrofolate reductase
MILSLIVAAGKNNEIGKDNQLLWHLPADLKHFKQLTLHHPVVMGRNTFESLPNGALPNRTNVVLTGDKEWKRDNCLVFNSIDAALLKLINEEEVFIIGGGQIYKQTLPIADKLYLTRVHADFPDANTFFPKINMHEWKETGRETIPGDEKNKYSFTFYEYERR